jgi:hypothetical protein
MEDFRERLVGVFSQEEAMEVQTSTQQEAEAEMDQERPETWGQFIIEFELLRKTQQASSMRAGNYLLSTGELLCKVYPHYKNWLAAGKGAKRELKKLLAILCLGQEEGEKLYAPALAGSTEEFRSWRKRQQTNMWRRESTLIAGMYKLDYLDQQVVEKALGRLWPKEIMPSDTGQILKIKATIRGELVDRWQAQQKQNKSDSTVDEEGWEKSWKDAFDATSVERFGQLGMAMHTFQTYDHNNSIDRGHEKRHQRDHPGFGPSEEGVGDYSGGTERSGSTRGSLQGHTDLNMGRGMEGQGVGGPGGFSTQQTQGSEEDIQHHRQQNSHNMSGQEDGDDDFDMTQGENHSQRGAASTEQGGAAHTGNNAEAVAEEEGVCRMLFAATLLAVYAMLSTVCCMLSTVCYHWLYAVCCMLYATTGCMLYAVCYHWLYAVCYMLRLAVCYLLPLAVCWIRYAVCCMLYATNGCIICYLCCLQYGTGYH